MTHTRCDKTPAWAALQAAFQNMGQGGFDLRKAFAGQASRFESFSQSAPHVFADLSKNLIDTATQQLLFDLARQTGLQRIGIGRRIGHHIAIAGKADRDFVDIGIDRVDHAH